MVQLTYPGVYIEELSSGVHTITGVATSIAAFVGWAPKGPTNQATMVESWSDYQRQFGGFTNYNGLPNYLPYAINQFFDNGGEQAYVIRLIWDGSLPPAPGTNPAAGTTAVATGIGFPTAQITAAVGQVSASATVNVGAPGLQSIAISPANLRTAPLGVVFSVFASGLSTWKSSDPTVVSISPDGSKVTTNKPGTATLTVTSGLISNSFALTVSAAGPSSIKITPATLSLAAGQSQQMMAVAALADGTSLDVTSLVKWSSSQAGEATITTASATSGGGLVTPVATAGTPTIAASLGMVGGSPLNDSASVTLSAAVPTAITLYPAAPVLKVGQSFTFSPIAMLSDGSTAALSGGTQTWANANLAVATVDASGLAKAVAPGVATVTLTFVVNAITLTASATVTVAAVALTSVSVTPLNASTPVWSGPSGSFANTPVLELQMSATGYYDDGSSFDLTHSVGWTATSTDAVVNANTGAVQGRKVNAGVTITATPAWDAAITGSASVAVTAPVLQVIELEGSLTKPTIKLTSGQTHQMTATPIYSDGGNTPPIAPIWSTSAPTTVSVSATGLATALASGGSLTLFASSPGAWGNSLLISIVPQAATPARFTLLGQQMNSSGQITTLESFANLSGDPSDPSYVVTVIDNDSSYLTFINPATGVKVTPSGSPAATSAPIALGGGADGAALVPASDQNFELALLNATGGLHLLDAVDIFNILCVPGETDAPTISQLQAYCQSKRAVLIVDAPQNVKPSTLASAGPIGGTPGSITSGDKASYSAYYFPWVFAPDPLFGNRPTLYPPCGFVAGLYAATDASRGVWKAPAGIGAGLTGESGLQYALTDRENGDLNPKAVNCLRSFKVYGDVIWGARTLAGDDQTASEWKYVPIRRLALFIESSLYNGTQWVVFEPNDEPLWSQIRMNVGVFMHDLFRQGAFQGSTPRQAYFVKCDAENNPQSSIDQGIVNVLVGFAPLHPAEFVVIQIQQMAGQLQA